MRVLGIAGSLRAGSFNRALLAAAAELAPAGMSIDIHDLRGLPLYDQDLEAQGDPASVTALKDAIGGADALLIATPEYNYGVPGVLKNAIDWASRPAGKSVLNGKPAAIMGASAGMAGTARAQLQLRQAFVFTQTLVVPSSEVLVAAAHEKFDANAHLSDPRTREHVAKLLAALAAWVHRLGSGS